MANQKIQLGMIGLSANQQAWATLTHVAPLKGEPLNKYYDITAMANSSSESAKAAAKAFDISEKKAYSSPEDIASDKDVDMVVVSVKVPLHHQLTMPALRAKKDVFVEWPLGANLAQAEEMTALAQKQGVKTVVGLQARQQAAVLKVRNYLSMFQGLSRLTSGPQAKEIIDSGKLGRVITTSVVNSSSAIYTIPPKNAYLMDPTSGANFVSIPVSHTLDPVLFTLGSEFAYLIADLRINFPDVLIQNADGKGTHTVKRDTPDSVTVSGVLKNGASVSTTFNITTPATPDYLSWIIVGEKASLKLESDNAQLQMAPDAKLSMYTPPRNGGLDSIYANPEPPRWAQVEVPKGQYFGGVAEVYQAFAEGKTEALVDFAEATKRHRMVDAIFRSAKNGTKETYES